jgi:hypothetical protein
MYASYDETNLAQKRQIRRQYFSTRPWTVWVDEGGLLTAHLNTFEPHLGTVAV